MNLHTYMNMNISMHVHACAHAHAHIHTHEKQGPGLLHNAIIWIVNVSKGSWVGHMPKGLFESYELLRGSGKKIGSLGTCLKGSSFS